jgi:menaquinone-9 beta-reductase
MKEVDVLVIGGGPAGLAAAIAARRKGLDVLIADCATPPVDKACGEGLMPDSLDALHALGVYVPVKEAAAIRGIRFVEGNRSIEASFARGNGITIRRTVLHRHLTEHAAIIGVEMSWGIRRLEFDSTQLSSGQLKIGGQKISSRFVIGADGQNSLLRHQVGLDAAWYESRRFGFRQHFRARPWSNYVEIYWGCRKQLFVTPTTEDEVCVALISRNPKLRLAQALSEFPPVQERLAGCEPTSSERGAVTVFRRLKRITKGNVALIGDAAGSVDPIAGEGMGLAFKQAIVLAESLASGTLEDYRRSHTGLNRRARTMSRLLMLLSASDGFRRRALYALSNQPGIFSKLLAIHVSQQPLTCLRAHELLRFAFGLIAV